MSYAKEIIDFIKRNRVSTTEVADALGKSGVIKGVVPISPDMHCVGLVHPVFTANNSNFAVHDQIREVEEGRVVIIFTDNCEGRAIIGDLIAKFVLLYRNCEAIVVDGFVRDAARLRRERFAMWSTGVSPLGCYNVPAEPFPADREMKIREEVDGGVAVCDDAGVVVIPKSKLNAEMLDRLHQIEVQEDIWYFCLDALKWDTKQIVCDRDYLKKMDQLPEAFSQHVQKLSKRLDEK